MNFLPENSSLSSRSANELDRHVVLAHDYLTQRGGAERVTVELANALNPKSILTALHSPNETFSEFDAFNVRPSHLNIFGFFRRDPRRALPFLPFAWSFRSVVEADVLVCSSSGWSHGARTSRRTKKIVYCHNPARWLYQSDDYVLDQSLFVRLTLWVLRPLLIIWDKRAAASVDMFIANSTSVAERVKRVYGRKVDVLHPPVSLNSSGVQDPIPGILPGFFLMVGRSRGYKGAQPLIDAFGALPEFKLIIAGGGGNGFDPFPNVTNVGYVSEAQLRWLYSNAKALISVSHEDFGLTPIEANSFGTPVLLLRAGGFIDSTHEGVSGKFIEDESVFSIREAVTAFPNEWDRNAIVAHSKQFSAGSFHRAIKAAVEAVLSGAHQA